MSIIRIEKNKNYTVMSNYHLREKKMSLKAKGLLSLMLSLPPNWDYSIAGLVAICKENETSIKSALDELKEFGYLQVLKKLPNQTQTGRIEYEYIVYEEKQGLENLGVEFIGVENQGQLNINKPITNKLNINNKKESKKEETFDDIINANCQNEKLKETLQEFIKMRKLIKKPLTNRALKLIIKKVKELSNGKGNIAIEILEQSITNCWQDVYALKNQPKQETNYDAKKLATYL